MQAFSFNLATEPWIPCITDGGVQEYPLRHAIAHSHEIREVVDPSPLITAALHRLLLAVVHRAMGGPSRDEDWQVWWQRSSFDVERLDRYFDEWYERFDLFDAERPFYQTPGLDRSKAVAVSKLAHERSAGNNALLFDHSVDSNPQQLEPAEAARYLIALQAFAVGGLVSFQEGEKEEHRSADAAPLAKGAMLALQGDNLFETLLLNMVNVNGHASSPFEFDPETDQPAWEREQPAAPRDRYPNGYLDLLTWQSRRVLLLPEEHHGSLAVSQVVLMKGEQFPDGFHLHAKETMMAFRKGGQAAKGLDPWQPVGFRPERALWRDSLALLQKATDARQRSRTVEELARRGLGHERPISLCAYGMSSDRAKVFLWRHERLPLPPTYLTDNDLLALLETALQLSERAADELRTAVRVLASKALFPAGDADKKRLASFVESLAAERPYWSALDVPFRRLMIGLADAWSGDEEHIPMREWVEAIDKAAGDAFETAARSLETSARGLRAAAEARAQLQTRLHQLTGPYLKSHQEERA